MKKIILLLIAFFALNSCTKDAGENSPKVYYTLVPIYRCNMPYTFTAGETYDFEMFYKQPTSCHFYKGIYFEEKPGNVRIVAIQCGVLESNDCVTYTDTPEMPLESKSTKCHFTAQAGEPYVFRFWTGKDDQGEDTYYDIEVPVEN